jgi:hypothetical protein
VRGDASAKVQSFDTHPLLLPPRKEHRAHSTASHRGKGGADAERRGDPGKESPAGARSGAERRRGPQLAEEKEGSPPVASPARHPVPPASHRVKSSSLFAAISELNFDLVELL